MHSECHLQRPDVLHRARMRIAGVTSDRCRRGQSRAVGDRHGLTQHVRQPDTQAVDANRGFQFDRFGLVYVPQAGKYLAGTTADWSEGEWNGDRVFDDWDMAAALRTGNYLQDSFTARLADDGFGFGLVVEIADHTDNVAALKFTTRHNARTG